MARDKLNYSDVDAGGDRFELADAFLQVGDLDPAASGREVPVGMIVGQLQPLELEPPVPGPQGRDAGAAQSGDDACGQHSNRQRVHHFSSCRSASISRASSSFGVLM